MATKSEARKREWADPDIRARRTKAIREGAKRRYQNPEQRKKAKDLFADQMADPEKARRFRDGQRKAIPKRNAAIRRHGLCESPEYKIWSSMIQRCTNPKNAWFRNYGARGIKVAQEWMGRGGFVCFITHIGRRTDPQLSVDRIDNEGDYTPGNVRWATRKEQSANSRKVRMVTIMGETHPLAEWARRIGVTPPTLARRIRLGWDEADLLLPPNWKR